MISFYYLYLSTLYTTANAAFSTSSCGPAALEHASAQELTFAARRLEENNIFREHIVTYVSTFLGGGDDRDRVKTFDACMGEHAYIAAEYVSFCKAACRTSQVWHILQVAIKVIMPHWQCSIVNAIETFMRQFQQCKSSLQDRAWGIRRNKSHL